MLVLQVRPSLHQRQLHQVRLLRLGTSHPAGKLALTSRQAFADRDEPTLLVSYSPVSGAVLFGAKAAVLGLLLGDERYVSFDADGLELGSMACAC